MPFENSTKFDIQDKPMKLPVFFSEVSEVVHRKQRAYNPEVFQSALRLASAKREERFSSGFLGSSKALARNILRNKENKASNKITSDLRNILEPITF